MNGRSQPSSVSGLYHIIEGTATVAKSPLEDVVSRWQKRSQSATSAGISPTVTRALATQDINKVLQGGSGISDQQANLALSAAATGHPVIQPPQRRTDPLYILGNAPNDFADIVRGLNPLTLSKGLIHEGQAARQEISTGQTPFTNVHDVGSFVRALSQQPIARLVPGVHTAGALTTSQGRKELERKPVSTLLDVLPAAGKVAEIGSAGKIAEEGSALSALQEGNPIKAASRASGLSSVLKKTAVKLGTDSLTRDILGKGYSVTGRKYSEPFNDWMKVVNETVSPGKKLSPEDIRSLTNDALFAKKGDLTPERAADVERIRGLTDRMGRENILNIIGYTDKSLPPDLIAVPRGDGGTEIYSADSPVVSSYNRASRWSERTVATQDVRDSAQVAVENAQRRVDSLKTQGFQGFMETNDQFFSREPSHVTMETLADAAKPLTETFASHPNVAEAFPEFVDKISTTNAARMGQALKQLAGENGVMAKLDEALKLGDYRSAYQSSSQALRILNYKALDGINTAERMRAFVRDLRENLIGLRGREGEISVAQRQLDRATAKLAQTDEKLAGYKTALAGRTQTYIKDLVQNPPARMTPILADLVRQGAMDKARLFYQGEMLKSAIQTIDEATTSDDIIRAFPSMKEGEAVWKDIKSDVVDGWTKLIEQGYDPVWMHNMPQSLGEFAPRVRPLPDHYYTPGVIRDTVFNLGPRNMNISMALNEAGKQLIQADATREFLDQHVMPVARPINEVKKEYFDALRNKESSSQFATLPGDVQAAMEKEWVEFDPRTILPNYKVRLTSEDKVVIPKQINDGMKLLMKNDRLEIKGIYNNSMRVYKLAVLTGPRHIAHIAFGGLAFMAYREPQALLKLGEAYNIVKNNAMDVELTRGIDTFTIDQLWHFSAGKTMGRLSQGLAGVGKFEETISDMYRVAVELSGEGRGLTKQAAIDLANKVFVDLDSFTPIERTIVKQVFPFYAFTKHLFRYLFTYPADHPVRAAILTRFANQEQADFNSGLPTKFLQTMFLGQPDSKGNVKTVDVKSLNPFRSLANDFTLAGFVSSLNPIATSIGSAAGINVLSATPELYPQMSYDPVSGSLVANRRDVVPKMLSAWVPEFGALDSLVGFSSDMKRLKRTDPEAFKQQLYSQLNLPFAPSKINVPQQEARTELNRYKAAQMAVSDALKSGNVSKLNEFNLVPYDGKLVPPNTIEQLLNQINAPKGVSKKSVLTPPRSR